MSLKRPIESTLCGHKLGSGERLFAIANGEVAQTGKKWW